MHRGVAELLTLEGTPVLWRDDPTEQNQARQLGPI